MPTRVQDVLIDRIARTLAGNAGFAWDRLDHYPGYLRTRWREEADRLLRRGAGNA